MNSAAEVHIDGAEPAAQFLEQRWLGQEPFSFTDDWGVTSTMQVVRRDASMNPAGRMQCVFWLVETDQPPTRDLPAVAWTWRSATAK
jgi:hypothetical protein